MGEVRANFRPEFLNRVDEIILFHRLKRENMGSIVDIQMKRLGKLLEERKIELKLDAKARDWLAEKGYDPAYGARPLKRVIQKSVQDPLAELILSGKVKDGETVAVSANKQGVTFNGRVGAAGGVSRLGKPVGWTDNTRRAIRHRALRPSMSYAQSVLQPGETIVATGRLHWIIYDWAILSLIFGTGLLILEFRYLPDHHSLTAVTAILFGALFVIFFAYSWFIRWITEFAVTNRRVISKRGFIWRATEEMNMDKVETVKVGQSIPGRVFDYGTIRIMGTGGTNEIYVRRIAAPFKLRNAIIAR